MLTAPIHSGKISEVARTSAAVRSSTNADLVAENGRRDQRQPEGELFDTGVFDDDRY